MEAGASGFLLEEGPAGELAAATGRVPAGERVTDPALAAAALSAGPNPLTRREQDVPAAVDGATVSDIARKLHLSPVGDRSAFTARPRGTPCRWNPGGAVGRCSDDRRASGEEETT